MQLALCHVPTSTAGHEIDFAVDPGPEHTASGFLVVHTPLVGMVDRSFPEISLRGHRAEARTQSLTAILTMPRRPVPPIRGLRRRPRRKPRRLYADRGYDFDKYRRLLWKRGIKPLIARRGVAHGSGPGKVRWTVERAFA